MKHIFDSTLYTYEIVNEEDQLTGEYDFDTDSFDMDYSFIKDKFLDLTKDADIIEIEGSMQIWSGNRKILTYTKLLDYQKIFDKYMTADDVKIEIDFHKQEAEYVGSHHDGSNYYIFRPIILIEKKRMELINLSLLLYDTKDEVQYALNKERDNCYISNCTKSDLVNIINEIVEE